MRWYAPHQLPDGRVPCAVDRSGVDPAMVLPGTEYATRLTPAERRAVVEQSARMTKSDYYATELLKRVVAQGRLEDPQERAAVIDPVAQHLAEERHGVGKDLQDQEPPRLGRQTFAAGGAHDVLGAQQLAEAAVPFFDEAFVSRGDAEIRAGQRQLDVIDQVGEEEPALVHLAEHRRAEPLGGKRQRTARAIPPREHVAALRPCVHPWDRAQSVDARAFHARSRSRADLHALDHVDRRDLAKELGEFRVEERRRARRAHPTPEREHRTSSPLRRTLGIVREVLQQPHQSHRPIRHNGNQAAQKFDHSVAPRHF